VSVKKKEETTPKSLLLGFWHRMMHVWGIKLVKGAGQSLPKQLWVLAVTSSPRLGETPQSAALQIPPTQLAHGLTWPLQHVHNPLLLPYIAYKKPPNRLTYRTLYYMTVSASAGTVSTDCLQVSYPCTVRSVLC